MNTKSLSVCNCFRIFLKSLGKVGNSVPATIHNSISFEKVKAPINNHKMSNCSKGRALMCYILTQHMLEPHMMY